MASLAGSAISASARPLQLRRSQAVYGSSGLKLVTFSGQRNSFPSVRLQQAPQRFRISCAVRKKSFSYNKAGKEAINKDDISSNDRRTILKSSKNYVDESSEVKKMRRKVMETEKALEILKKRKNVEDLNYKKKIQRLEIENSKLLAENARLTKSNEDTKSACGLDQLNKTDRKLGDDDAPNDKDCPSTQMVIYQTKPTLEAIVRDHIISDSINYDKKETSGPEQSVKDKIEKPDEKEDSVFMEDDMVKIKKTEQSSLVKIIKTAVRKTVVKIGFMTTNKQIRRATKCNINKPPSKRFPGGKYRIYNMLSERDKVFMDDIHNLYGDSYVWQEPPFKIVLLEDLIHLIGNDSISNMVVDAYTSILSRTFEANNTGRRRNYFFSSNAFFAARDKLPDGMEQYIFINLKISNQCNYNFFPILSAKNSDEKTGYHWTLLVLDTMKGLWTHYNPIRGQPGRIDHYFNDALIMKETIDNYFQTNFEYGTTQTDISSNVNCPQQESNTVDCGPMICYYMKKLSEGHALNEKIPRDTIKQFRAEMASSILNDEGYSRELAAIND